MDQPPESISSPFGHWSSTVTAESLSAESVSLHEVANDSSSRRIYWIESRPQENGRFTIMESAQRRNREILPKRFSAHAMVNELGGGSFAVDSKGRIIFVDEETHSVHELCPDTQNTGLVLEAEAGARYADFAPHPHQYEWIVAAKEDHKHATPETQAFGVKNSLVAINRLSAKEHTIVDGDDFFSYPRFSNDGSRLCWVQWSHPDMPWTGTVLYVAEWLNGKISNIRRVAGQSRNESVSQPRWTSDNRILFANDKNGFWQLYCHSPESSSTEALVFDGLHQSDFAIADWKLGSSTFIPLTPNVIVASAVTNGGSNIVILDVASRSYRDLGLEFSDLAMPGTGIFQLSTDSFVVLGSTSTASKQLVQVSDVQSQHLQLEVLTATITSPIAEDTISEAQRLVVPRTLRSGIVHALLFGPKNPHFHGPPGCLPPCLIHLHGGPNGCMSPALDLTIQFWTSRGYAVCSINYAGSTGFGRQYREELTGYWGLYDVQDTHDVVQYLKSEGLVDASRIGIYGGSAGGYGTLSAIHSFPDMFAAAVSSYGICDVRALQSNSYKFESHDVERLIMSSCTTGTASDRAQLLRQRSPLFFAREITAPLLILQGSDDVAVLPEQAHMMADEMRRLDRPVKVVEFAGEGHGWLKQDTILRALEEQEAWWKRHLAGA